MFHIAKKLVVRLALITIFSFGVFALPEKSGTDGGVSPVDSGANSDQCSNLDSDAYKRCENRTIRELTGLGKPGNMIIRSREQTIDILRTPNECSAWFQEVEPNVEGVFRSLHFELDQDGNTEISRMRGDSGETLFKDPWGAKTNQLAGMNATVQINGNGAFFVRASRVRNLYPADTLMGHSGWQLLSLASFIGDTPEARLVIMLHELGHITGRLPEDTDSWDGQSSRNTMEVLRHCKGDIEAIAHKPYRHHN
jgi:hypothetical protein